MSFNPYEVLGLHKDCNEKDIQKAYKVQCLRWHPDKNPDRVEEANRRFIEAKKAVDLLLDKEKRAEYDSKVQRKANLESRQKERREKQDGVRQKMYDDLLRREKEHLERGHNYAPAKSAQESDEKYKAKMRRQHEEQARAETEALRKKWEAEVEEEIRAQNERLRAQVPVHHDTNDPAPKLKVKWTISNENEDYDETALRIIFDPYAPIDEVVIIPGKKNKRTALIVYKEKSNPWGAETETGAGGSDLECVWVVKPSTEASTTIQSNGKEKGDDADKDFASLSFQEMEAQLRARFGVPETKRSRFDDDDV